MRNFCFADFSFSCLLKTLFTRKIYQRMIQFAVYSILWVCTCDCISVCEFLFDCVWFCVPVCVTDSPFYDWFCMLVFFVSVYQCVWRSTTLSGYLSLSACKWVSWDVVDWMQLSIRDFSSFKGISGFGLRDFWFLIGISRDF